MHDFAFAQPENLAEALSLLKDPESYPLAGGQTLIPTLKQRLAAPKRLVSLTGISELSGVIAKGATVRIGATATHSQVEESLASAFPALSALAGQIGDRAVRNRGTIGGSLANNDPSADYPAAVLACRATIHTRTEEGGARDIAADDFFDGLFSTTLEEGMLISAVSFPVPQRAGWRKFAQPASRFALAGVFVAQFADASVRLAITGASQEGVFRWHEAEAALAQDFRPESLAALSLDEGAMIADMHGSAAYRAHLGRVLACRAVADCFQAATVA